MEVTFTLTPSDFWAFSRNTILGQPKLWLKVLASILVVAVIWAMVIVDLLHDTSEFLPIMAGVTVVWAAITILLLRRSAIRRARDNPAALKPTTARITPDELRLLQETMDQRVAWQAVHSVVAQSRHIYLYRTSQTAWIIPRRAFANPSDSDAFLRAAYSYYQEAKKSPKPLDSANRESAASSNPYITFDFTLEDSLNYEKMFIGRVTRVSTGRVYGFGGYLVVAGLMLCGLSLMRTGGSLYLTPSAIVGIVCVGWGILMLFSRSPWQTRRKVRVLVASTPGLACQRTVSIDPSAFYETTSVSDLKMAWSALHDVTEQGDYIYIFSNPTRAHAIPKRAFDTPYSAQAFFHAARGYLQQAKSGGLADKPAEGVWPPSPTARP